jgi:sarcosine oxidase subunit gamma
MLIVSAFTGCKPIAPAHEGASAVPVAYRSAVSVTAWPGKEASLADALNRAFALDLPAPGRWTRSGALVALWVGPAQVLLQCESASPSVAQIAAAVADLAAVIDVSDSRAVLRVSGPESRSILAALLPIDLHPRVFGPGHAATTLAAHLTVQVRQIDDTPSYDLAVSRSFAGSLWRALELAGAGRLRLG